MGTAPGLRMMTAFPCGPRIGGFPPIRSWKTVHAKSSKNFCLMAPTPGESWGFLASNTPLMTDTLLILGGSTGCFQSPFKWLTVLNLHHSNLGVQSQKPPPQPHFQRTITFQQCYQGMVFIVRKIILVAPVGKFHRI
jgi:hypothetical protein